MAGRSADTMAATCRDGSCLAARRRALRPNLDPGCAEGHVDRPDLVGPKDDGPDGGQPLEHLAGRMPVVVPRADRDRRQARARRLDQRRAGRRPAPVVAGLEEVHGREAPRDQLSLDRGFGISHQQEASALERAEEDDRRVVHLGAVVGGIMRHAGRTRPDHLEGDPVEGEVVTCSQAPAACPAGGENRCQRLVTRTGARHAGLRDLPDAVALEEEWQARHVVLVRVGEHDEVDPAVPRRHARVKGHEQAVRVGTAVHEHAAARRAGYEDRVALPDVEDDHVGPAVRPRRTGDDDDRHGDGTQQPGDLQEPGRAVPRRPRPSRRCGARGAKRRQGLPQPPPPGDSDERRDHDRRPACSDVRRERDARQRERGRDPDDPDHQAERQRAGDAEDCGDDARRPERRQGASGQGEGAGRHRQGNERDHRQVGDRREGRHALEGREDEGQRRRLGCQRDAESFTDPPRHPARPPVEEGRDRGRPGDEAGRGRGRELEPDVVRARRVRDDEAGDRPAQRRCGGARPP
ncbi:MAG TPA: hypothetical protein VLM76_12730 [Patescibacteria group bacterium]|nr:hypothetical protein [Patescibacteria group bacterium]